MPARPVPVLDQMFAHGELVGSYRIGEILGEGTTAVVYEADDLSLGRKVAIKASRSEATPEWLVAEARLLASLHHPGLPTVFAIGSHHGIPYLVMERVEGMTLRDHLERRGQPLSIDETIDVLTGLADALACVHARGLTHRDVKPENVMLCGGRVVLLDFGLHGTSAEEIAGTPDYMAPETIAADVCHGEEHLVDLYSLGIIGFEAVTGYPPYDGDTVPALLHQHLSAPVPIAEGIYMPLARLLAELMSKQPHRRPPSADLVARLLRAMRQRRAFQPAEDLDVLVVDDDPDLRALVKACVEHAIPRARVRIADDGLDALEKFVERPADLVVFDLDMPRMNGVELCMAIRGTSRGDTTTLIAVSSRIGASDAALLAQLGVHDLLGKQTLMSGLFDLLQRVQRSRSLVLVGHEH